MSSQRTLATGTFKKVATTHTNDNRTRAKSGDHRQPFAPRAEKTRSQKAARWNAIAARKETTGRLSSSSSEDVVQIGGRRSPRDNPPVAADEPLITLPVEQASPTDVAPGRDTAEALLSSLADLVHLPADQVEALRTNQSLMQCLTQLDADCLEGTTNRRGKFFLKQTPPLQLIHELARCGLGASAAKLIRCCRMRYVVDFACKLLSDPAALAGVPKAAINKCIQRASEQLELAPAELKERFHDALRTLHGPALIVAPFELRPDSLAEPEAASTVDWHAIEHGGNVGFSHSDNVYRAKEALGKFELLRSAFQAPAANVTYADRQRATKMLQRLCTHVALLRPAALRDMEQFAHDHGLLLDPAPSTAAFWQAEFEKKDNLDFCVANAKGALAEGSFGLAVTEMLTLWPSAQKPWLKMFKSLGVASIDQQKHAPSKAKNREKYWTLASPYLKAADQVACDWPSFKAGDITQGMGQTGQDAETFIHFQLQEADRSEEKLASLYIAALIHGVHESPLLDFKPGTAKLAFTHFMEVLAETDGATLSHFSSVAGAGVNLAKVVRVALALTKMQEFSLAVSLITEHLIVWDDLRNTLLRTLAAGGKEYQVVQLAFHGLVFAQRDNENRNQLFRAFFLQFGKTYPLSPEIVKKMAQDQADAGKTPGVDQALSAFIEGYLTDFAERLEKGPRPVPERDMRDFSGVLQEAKKSLLTKGKYDELKKLEKDLKALTGA